MQWACVHDAFLPSFSPMTPPAGNASPDSVPAAQGAPVPPPLPPLITSAPPAPSAETLAVMAELHKPEKADRSWVHNLMLLLVSLVLFVSLGFLQWAVDQIVLLLLVLFIHEAGHYFAMRWFDYQNVKMFFIPFFGAAVSGRPVDAPGYKKVIVALMGPVPGILIGLVIAGSSWFMHLPNLKNVAFMFIFINAFNLLPFFPLDGGHVLQEVLFSRNRWTEALFKAAAGLAFLVLGFATHGFILKLIGFFVLFTILPTFKVNTLAQWFRSSGRGAVPAAADLTPSQCERLARAVRSEFRTSLKPAQLAGLIRTVLEKAKAQPPDAMVSVCLLLAYGGAFFAALIGLALLFLQKSL